MPGIYIAHVISTSLVLGVWGTLILRRAEKRDWALFILLFILQLPMSALTYYIVRVPLDAWYAELLGKGSKLYIIAKSFEAPLTEEPAKLLPLLLPFIFYRIKKENALLAGMALGLGFGVGEIWTLVYLFAQKKSIFLSYPWYMFWGGIQERFIASFTHAIMTGLAVYGIAQGLKKAVAGIGTAMMIHYFLNFPILLPAMGLIPRSLKGIWLNIVAIYSVILFLILLNVIWKYLYGRPIRLTLFLGKSTCPNCGIQYDPTLWGTLNFTVGTYERCPECKKWHFSRFKFFKKNEARRS